MNKIYLVRHGESEGNVNKRVYETKPDYAIELTETGKAQASEAAYELLKRVTGSRMILSSTYRRARETAKIIKDILGVDFYRESPLIIEQEWRSCLAVDTDNPEPIKADLEKNRDEYGRFYFRFPNGESNLDCYIRASLAEPEIRNYVNSHNLIIVTHGMFMRVILMKMLNFTPEEFELLRNPKNCQIIEIEPTFSGYKLNSTLEKHEKLLRKY